MAKRNPYLIAAIVIVVIVVAAAAFMFLRGGEAPGEAEEAAAETPTPAEAAEGVRTIVVTATEFSFDPDTITVSPGETIVIIVRNEGRVFHTFTIDELGIDVALNPGDEERIEITVPEGVERITFYCRPHVGLGMVGELVVQG